MSPGFGSMITDNRIVDVCRACF